MINQEVAEWIKKERSAGYTDDQLRASLLQKGHSPRDVEDTFNSLNQVQEKPNPSAVQSKITEVKPKEIKKEEPIVQEPTQEIKPAPVAEPISSKPSKEEKKAAKLAKKEEIKKAKEEKKAAKLAKKEASIKSKSIVQEPKVKAPKEEPKPEIKAVEPKVKSSKKELIIIFSAIAFVLLLMGGGGFYYYANYIASPTGEYSEYLEEYQQASNTEELLACASLADSLETCTPFSCVNEDGFSREIAGQYGNECKVYMSLESGDYSCDLPSEYVIAISQYLKDSEKSSTDSNVMTVGTIYMIGELEVENPVEQAIVEGICYTN